MSCNANFTGIIFNHSLVIFVVKMIFKICKSTGLVNKVLAAFIYVLIADINDQKIVK